MDTQERILIVNGSRGIYVPKHFIMNFTSGWNNITDEQRDIISCGPEHDDYWEVWDEILDQANYTQDNKTYSLMQEDGDLFAVVY